MSLKSGETVQPTCVALAKESVSWWDRVGKALEKNEYFKMDLKRQVEFAQAER